MAEITGKRKRETASSKAQPCKKPASQAAVKGPKKPAPRQSQGKKAQNESFGKAPQAAKEANGSISSEPIHLQVVTGSYERVLHGISARIPRSTIDRAPPSNETSSGNETTKIDATSDVTFSDNFLFAAHASAIRCLAISNPTTDSDKCFLATGSSDERINVYSLSTTPPAPNSKSHLPFLTGTHTAENPRNKSLGSLIHHDRAITRLQFPTKTKLFSSAEDATISISRTRDWTVLSSIKAPIPKPQGRPSGDTAGPGEIPAGINDFAIHPSQKLMLSVGRGERCMRLWNLMTGKKAGVLNFDRDLLSQVGEGKFGGNGEGKRVLWDEAGENYVVGFERGAAVFGIDSKPTAVIRPSPQSKFHEMRFVALPSSQGSVLAISTEDGRVLFFDIGAIGTGEDGKLPLVPCVSQLGGAAAGLSGRVKDFAIVPLRGEPHSSWAIVTAGSDGIIRLWTVFEDELANGLETAAAKAPRQVGRLIVAHATGHRITCLGAFIMDGKVSDGAIEGEAEELAGAEEDGESEDDEDE